MAWASAAYVLTFVYFTEEALVGVVDAKAEARPFPVAESMVDFILKVINVSGELTGVHLADAGAPGLIPLEVFRPRPVVLVGVVVLQGGINRYQMPESRLHQSQGQQRPVATPQCLASLNGTSGDEAWIARTEQPSQFMVIDLAGAVGVQGDDSALRGAAAEVVDFTSDVDVGCCLDFHSLQQF